MTYKNNRKNARPRREQRDGAKGPLREFGGVIREEDIPRYPQQRMISRGTIGPSRFQRFGGRI